MIRDEDFIKYAEEQEVLFKSQKSGDKTQFLNSNNFETIRWTGFTQDVSTKIIRVYGGIPGRESSDPTIADYTARIVNVAWIVGDDGKKIRCILPAGEDYNKHLIKRIIDRVSEVEWENNKRVYVIEKKFPQIYDLVMYNGLKKNNPKRKFERGWKGQNVIIMNVIDRAQMEWHRYHKHSMLFSKNVVDLNTVDDTQSQYAIIGIPVYGFYTTIISKLFKYYGNWNKYDIGIIRTGRMDLPYEIFNASAYKLSNLPELTEPYKSLVSTNTDFTEEEKSWNLYNLRKLFAYTKFRKIKDHLSEKIKEIDSVLNTNFYDELMWEVEKEEKEDAEKKEENLIQQDNEKIIEKPDINTINLTSTSPKKERVSNVNNLVLNNQAKNNYEEVKHLLKGDQYLKEDFKPLIKEFVVKNGKITNIIFDEVTYKDENGNSYFIPDSLEVCPKCGIATPSFFNEGCIVCGLNWNAWAASV